MSEELRQQSELIHEVARQVMGEHGMTIDYMVGTMIELSARGADGGSHCSARAVFLVWNKRPYSNDVWIEPRRFEPLSSKLHRTQDHARRSVSGAWIETALDNSFGWVQNVGAA